MTDLLNNCPRCGHAFGHCTHTTQGEITILPVQPPIAAVIEGKPLPGPMYFVYDDGRLEEITGVTLEQGESLLDALNRERVKRSALGIQFTPSIPTRPQPTDTAIVASPVLAAAGGLEPLSARSLECLLTAMDNPWLLEARKVLSVFDGTHGACADALRALDSELARRGLQGCA